MGIYVATADGIATGTALKTILQIASAASDKLVVTQISVTFDGVTASAVPVEVRLQRQTSAGTGGAALATNYGINGYDPADGTASATALKGPAGTWTAEPTASSILDVYRVPPTSGIVVQYPLGQEPFVAVSSRIAIVVTSAATVNCTASIFWRE
jgi:hypothetical protein